MPPSASLASSSVANTFSTRSSAKVSSSLSSRVDSPLFLLLIRLKMPSSGGALASESLDTFGERNFSAWNDENLRGRGADSASASASASVSSPSVAKATSTGGGRLGRDGGLDEGGELGITLGPKGDGLGVGGLLEPDIGEGRDVEIVGMLDGKGKIGFSEVPSVDSKGLPDRTRSESFLSDALLAIAASPILTARPIEGV